MKILFISPYLLMPNIGAHIGSLSHLNAIKKVFNEDDICTVAINPGFQKQETMLPINYIIKWKQINHQLFCTSCIKGSNYS